MAKDSQQNVRASVYAVTGALWLSLTGLCTWNYAKTAGPYGSFWPVGLWFASIGALPLVVGLRTFIPARPLGWATGVAAASWLIYGVKWLADAFVDAAKGGGGDIMAFVILLWVVFEVPGGLMLWGAVAILRGAGKAAPPDTIPPRD